MRKYRVLVILLPVVMIFCFLLQYVQRESSAQGMVDVEMLTLQRRVQLFFDSVAVDPTGSTVAYQTIFSESQLQDPAVQEMILKTDELVRNGRWRFEFIGSKSVGTDVILMRYLYKGEAYPVVWYFTFYRSSQPGRTVEGAAATSTWNCIGVRFDTELENLF